MKSLKKYFKKVIIFIYRILFPLFDPLNFFKGVKGYFFFIYSLIKYCFVFKESISLFDLYPQTHENLKEINFDTHYFYLSGWAFRKINSNEHKKHIEIGFQPTFVNLLSSIIPVIFLDFRPLKVNIRGLTIICGDILNLPFQNGSVESISCLHVAEHIGLGRYGEPLNSDGTKQACDELKRVLAPGGNLYFAIPIGRERICFNAHRIYSPEKILEFFNGLEIIEFSCVQDNGKFFEKADLNEFKNCDYACGMFWFKRI